MTEHLLRTGVERSDGAVCIEDDDPIADIVHDGADPLFARPLLGESLIEGVVLQLTFGPGGQICEQFAIGCREFTRRCIDQAEGTVGVPFATAERVTRIEARVHCPSH